MNYPAYMTLVGWETRSWRHREKALLWCRDYGLKPVTKHLFIGALYAKERAEMQKKFKDLFANKTERFFFATMCKTCFNESMSGMPIQGNMQSSHPFELVQMP